MIILSGGQTGSDRAALDWALASGVECGGHCPLGRIAEDGVIAERYPLQECESSDYRMRTRKNVEDAHGTVVFSWGELSGGSLLTANLCMKLAKPFLHVDGTKLEPCVAADELKTFLDLHFIGVLNVAGPRASHAAGIYEYTYRVLDLALGVNRAPSGMS